MVVVDSFASAEVISSLRFQQASKGESQGCGDTRLSEPPRRAILGDLVSVHGSIKQMSQACPLRGYSD